MRKRELQEKSICPRSQHNQGGELEEKSSAV